MPLAWSTLLLPRLPILSRCYLVREKETPGSSLSLFASFPRAKRPASGETRSLRIHSGPYLHIDYLPFLTPEILPIVTDARVRECERNCICIRGGLSRSACIGFHSSLAGRQLAAFAIDPKEPRKAASLSRRGVARNSALHRDRNDRDKPRYR